MNHITHGAMPEAVTTNEKGAGAANSSGPHINTNIINFRTDGAINQAHDGNAIADQIAWLAVTGHVVQKGADGEFIVSQNDKARHCADFAEPAVFRWQLAGDVIRSFIQTLSYWLIQSAPYATAILLGVVVGVLA